MTALPWSDIWRRLTAVRFSPLAMRRMLLTGRIAEGVCAARTVAATRATGLFEALRQGARTPQVLAQELNLMHCIECSRCDKVCPSHIPLTESYQAAKIVFKRQREDKSRAARARKRFELHQRRMEKFNSEEEARRIKRATLANKNHQAISSENIQAALDRVKAKKTSH